MPKISLVIPEVDKEITRPIAMSVSRDIMRMTGLPERTSLHYFSHGDAVAPQTGSTLDDVNQKPGFPYTDKFTIDVDEEYQAESAITQSVLRPETMVVFKDSDLGVYVKPVYQATEMRISIVGRFKDRPTAVKWQNDIRKRISQGKAENLHELEYHYPIPLEFWVLLDQIYKMREKVEGYGEDIGEWIRGCMDERHSVLVNQASKNPTIVVREKQIGVVGWFDFDAVPPNPDTNGPEGAFTASFSYTIRYDKCVACVMQYPLMIHNQLMPRNFRDNPRPYEFENQPHFYSLTRGLLEQHAQRYPGSYGGYVGCPIPSFDDWLPEYKLPNLIDLLRMMIQLDINDTETLISLHELGNHAIDPDAILYMEDYPEGMIKERESIFQLHLYQGYKPLPQDYLTIDQSLTVKAAEGLSLRKHYHLVLSLGMEIESLSEAARGRLRRHGKFCQKLMKLMAPDIEQVGLLPRIVADGSVPLVEFNKASRYITAKRYLGKAPDRYMRYLVGQFIIETSGDK